MRLTTQLKRSNPVATPAAPSPQARVRFRAMLAASDPGGAGRTTGTHQADEASPSPARPRLKWPVSRRLAPILAATTVVAGIGLGFGLQWNQGAPYAFADTVTATVLPGQITPQTLGTSLMFDIPYPDSARRETTHIVERVWMHISDEQTTATWNWTTFPDSLVFRLQKVVDDIGFYLAEDWPFEKAYRLVIVAPGSSTCLGGDPPDDGANPEDLMMESGFNLCAFPSAEATPRLPTPEMEEIIFQHSGYSSSSLMTHTITLRAVTTQPSRLIEQMRQFNLRANGTWESVPAGYENWTHRLDMQAYLGDDCDQTDDCALLSPPDPGVLEHGAYGFALPSTPADKATLADAVVGIWVNEDQTCVIKAGMEYLDEVGITLNPDGSCTYNP